MWHASRKTERKTDMGTSSPVSTICSLAACHLHLYVIVLGIFERIFAAVLAYSLPTD